MHHALLAQLVEHRERELRAVHLLRDLLVELLEIRGVHEARLADLGVALGEDHAQLLDRPLDAGGDLAGLLVAGRLGELGARMGERAQSVPARDHMLGGGGDRVERIAQGRGRRLEILREDDFLFALQRARAADLLEIGLERATLAAGIELLGGDDRRGTHADGFVGVGLLLLLRFQLASSSSPVQFSLRYRPRGACFKQSLDSSSRDVLFLIRGAMPERRMNSNPGPRIRSLRGTRRSGESDRAG